MKTRTLTILFCSLALVHLAAQFTVFYVWVRAHELDDVQYDAVADWTWGSHFTAISFPGGARACCSSAAAVAVDRADGFLCSSPPQ